jgi:HD-GYP domain-containing protein (c-di-GMP phosphodiesterase class II)
VRHLALALREQTLYGAFHPAVLRASEEVADALSLLLGEQEEFDIRLSYVSILVNDQPLSPTKGIAADLVKASARHGIDQIVFSGQVVAEDVAVLVHLLGESREQLDRRGGIYLALAKQGVTGIVCGIQDSSGEVSLEHDRSAADASLLSTYEIALSLIQESAQQASLGRVLNTSAAQALAGQLADNMIEDQAKLLELLSIRRHDEYTFRHSLNVCILALALGMAMGLDRPRLHELGLAALLHDVGKAQVPLEVLRKPGPLSEKELTLVQRHPVSGASCLSLQPGVPTAAALVAFQHHLRHDQTGYPTLRWPQSPNAYSLVVGIADAYEALTSERPYRRTRGPEEALTLMLGTPPGQFEPRMLDVFAEMLSKSHLLGDSRDIPPEGEPSSRE